MNQGSESAVRPSQPPEDLHETSAGNRKSRLSRVRCAQVNPSLAVTTVSVQLAHTGRDLSLEVSWQQRNE